MAMDGSVLIMDYSDYERGKVRVTLESISDMEIVEVANIKQFGEVIKSRDNISLIIMDITFPIEKSGLDILKELRKNPKTARTPIVIVTKMDKVDLRDEAIKYHVKDYIIKPYQTMRLEKSIRSIIKIEEKFTYSFNSANVISMSIEDYIAKEIKISSRARKCLSIILITPMHIKDGKETEDPFPADIKENIYGISTERVRLSSRTTDTVILNDYKDILVILPFTDSMGAKAVNDKIIASISEGLSELGIRYNSCFYSVSVTYPEEGNHFQALMENAFKKVESKRMLEKITSISADTLKNASQKYNRFRL